MQKVNGKVVVFCTYKNKSTNNEWRKSREYESMQVLLAAMCSYLENHPHTVVTYQTRQVYEFNEGVQ